MDTVLKIYVRACGESSYCTNALTFDSVKAAQNYGNDLLSRWFGADNFIVVRVKSTGEVPNRIDERTAQLVNERLDSPPIISEFAKGIS